MAERRHEDLLPALLHLVERPDLRHPALDAGCYGELVGEDEFGNRYYRTRGGKIDPTLLMERRWVIYNGVAEPSMVPPSWHGWLHHTVDTPPTEENYKPRSWQKPHRPNLTGTPAAHRPTGSTLAPGPPPEGDRRLQGLDSGPLVRCAANGLARPFPALFAVLTG